MDEVDKPELLGFGFSNPAYADVASAIGFIRRVSGNESAFIFNERLDETIAALRARISQEIASHGKPFDAPDESASLHYSTPIYRERLEINRKRRRGSSSGLWYIYYSLQGKSATSGADSIVIVRIRHSASEPFAIVRSDDEPDDE